MEIPTAFTDQLDIDFQGRLRARWSPKQQAVIIEQRMARNVIGSLNRKFVLEDERRQSLAEGYKAIATIAVTEKVKCPSGCGYSLDVPNRETRQIVCLNCKLKGRRTAVIAGYYPLNTYLLNHLKSIDPLRNMDNEQLLNATVDHNERITEQQQKQLLHDADAYASDNLSKLMQIPTFGYSQTNVKAGTEVKGF